MTTEETSQRPDWLYGTGTGIVERRIVHATVLAVLAALGVALAVRWNQPGLAATWTWWRLLIAAVLVVDVAGGAVANALDGAKRLYHGPVPQPATVLRRLVHDHRTFAALHVHPIVVGVVFPGGPWWWGPLWYLWALIGVLVVVRLPRYLERPVATGVVEVGATVATLVPAPAGFAWFPAVLLLKLVLSHAVAEVTDRS